ncbi:unnamed protein product, partial [Ixodes hexagonus]
MPVIYCPLCPFYDVKFIRVVNHLGLVHANAENFRVTCGLDRCVKVFSCFENYRRHLYRNHNMLAIDTVLRSNQPTPSAQPTPTEATSSLPSFDEGTEPMEWSDDSSWPPGKEKRSFVEEVRRSLLLFHLKMTESLKLPHSTAETIFSMIKLLLSATLKNFAEEVEEQLTTLEVELPDSSNLETLLQTDDLVDLLFAGIETKYQRTSYQQGLLAGDHRCTIFLLLYTDELELNNPLGPAAGKNKILLVYFSILNIHPRHRSKLSSMHLLLIAPYSIVVEFGLEALLEPLIKDLNFLMTHGLKMPGQIFRVSVVAVVGDNLSLNRLAGLTCSFSKGRVSRFCLAKYEDLGELTLPTQCVRRSAASHASHLAAFFLDPTRNGRLYGITGPSALASLEGFDIMRQLPPDAMHDILEGAIAVLVKVVLRGLVDSGVVKKDDLNRICQFSYGPHDKKSKPVFDPNKFLTPSGTLKGTA